MAKLEHDLTKEQWTALQVAWGACAYCGGTDKPLRATAYSNLAWRAVHAGERRAGLLLVQHQQVQWRSHRLAPPKAARRAGLPATSGRGPEDGARAAPADRILIRQLEGGYVMTIEGPS